MAVIEPVLIDLGEERLAPVTDGRRRPPPGRRFRAVAAALSLAGLALIGPTPPMDPLVESRVPAGQGDFLDVQDDRIYVTSSNGGEVGFQDRSITAYRLPDGARLWQVPVRITGEGPSTYRLGGMLLINSHDTETGEVLAIDDETGAIRWRRQASLLSGVPGAAGQGPGLLIATAEAAEGEHPTDISAVDVRTGEPRWSYKMPSDATMDFAWQGGRPEGSRLITGLRSGRIEVRDLATGRLTAAATLGRPLEWTEGGPELISYDGLLLKADLVDPQLMSAYGLDRLDHRWTARIEHGDSVLYGQGDCGDELLCLGNGENQTLAVERDTGRVRWRGEWQWLTRAGTMLLAGVIPQGPDTAPMVMLDPATGRTIRDLGKWHFVDWYASGDAERVVVRHETGNRAWIGLIDAAIPDVQVLGVVSSVTDDCRGGRESVVCRRTDGGIGIWRYR